MPEFLSDEWIAACDAAAGANAALGTGERLVVEQHVTEVPGGADVTYHLVLGGGRAAFATGPAAAAGVRIDTDHATAVELARGTANAQQALATGRLRVRGDLERLVEHAPRIEALGDVFRAVRAATTFARR